MTNGGSNRPDGDEVSGQPMGDGDQTHMGEHQEEYTNGLGMSPVDRRAGGHGGDAPTGGGMGHDDGEPRVHEAWRTVALMLAAALMTGFGSWLLFDRDQPTRAEVRQIVDQEVKPVAAAMQSATYRLEKLADEAGQTRDQFNHLLGRLENIVGESRRH